MPTSKKPRKKTSAKKKAAAENVITFPDPRGMEGIMADMLDSGSNDSLNQAQDLMYDAWENTAPKKRIALAKEAIKISPLCADAYCLLAEESAKTLEEALTLYRQAVDAGKEALGPEAFKEYAGEFWGFLETRPYMRACAGLAEVLWIAGDRDAAIETFKEMIKLNPNDNQGIRYILAAKLLDMGNMVDLKALLERYVDEYSADIQYTRALIAFSEDADNADDIAQYAYQTNEHVPAILSGKKRPVQIDAYISMGGEDEASGYVEIFGHAWKKTPGAIDWLSKVTATL